MYKITLVVIFVVIAASNAQATWKDCSGPSSHGKVSGIIISPAQPVKGAPFTIDGTGTVDEAMTASQYTLKIALNGIPVFTHSGDGCKPDKVQLPLGMGEVDLAGLPCPTTAGQAIKLHESVSVAKTSPNGKFTTTFTAVDQNNQPALCVEIDFTMSGEEEETEVDSQEKKPLKLRTISAKADPGKPTIVEVIGKGFKGANGHYEDPLDGSCGAEELNVTVTGIAGSFCSPKCTLGAICPKDVPTGVTAKPQCALQDSTGGKYCALICTPANEDPATDACGTNASCKAVPGHPTIGLCTYDK